MVESNPSDITPKLLWAGRVWGNLTRLQCAGILHIALRYGERQADSNAYIESMSLLPWSGLGHPLQVDIMKALHELQNALVHTAFGR